MNGRITVDSEPGQTVFALVLPLGHRAEHVSREITPVLS
jgi:nitrogen-specific signal transduction histidine kinase